MRLTGEVVPKWVESYWNSVVAMPVLSLSYSRGTIIITSGISICLMQMYYSEPKNILSSDIFILVHMFYLTKNKDRTC